MIATLHDVGRVDREGLQRCMRCGVILAEINPDLDYGEEGPPYWQPGPVVQYSAGAVTYFASIDDPDAIECRAEDPPQTAIR